MIPGFLKTIQKDFDLQINWWQGKLPSTKEADLKVHFASLRLFAVIGMAATAVKAVTELPFFASAPASTLFNITLLAVACAVLRDIFVMSRNYEEQTTNALAGATAIGLSVLSDVVDVVQGHKNPGKDAPRHRWTLNTVLRPMWDEILARIPQIDKVK